MDKQSSCLLGSAAQALMQVAQRAGLPGSDNEAAATVTGKTRGSPWQSAAVASVCT